jgi:rRNA processing protein Krr1/Pno1
LFSVKGLPVFCLSHIFTTREWKFFVFGLAVSNNMSDTYPASYGGQMEQGVGLGGPSLQGAAVEQEVEGVPLGGEPVPPSAVEDPSASAVPPDAAARAAEIAARLSTEHGGEETSLKRKYENDESEDPSKKPYLEVTAGTLLSIFFRTISLPNFALCFLIFLFCVLLHQGGNGSVLPPIAPPAPLGSENLGTGEASETVMCPHTFVGKVIGKGGETIRDLQGRSGARIQIDHTGEEGKPRTVTISGSATAVATAKQMVEAVIAQGQDPATAGITATEAQESVDCPPGIVGRVIGRGGETIRALQAASGAHISIDQNFPEGANRKVHIQGNKEAVERGFKMVTELIEGGPGSANDVIQKVIQKVE